MDQFLYHWVLSVLRSCSFSQRHLMEQVYVKGLNHHVPRNHSKHTECPGNKELNNSHLHKEPYQTETRQLHLHWHVTLIIEDPNNCYLKNKWSNLTLSWTHLPFLGTLIWPWPTWSSEFFSSELLSSDFWYSDRQTDRWKATHKSPPVLMHGGLLCVTFRLSVCPPVKGHMGQGQRSRGSRSNEGYKQRQVGSRQRQVASFFLWEAFLNFFLEKASIKTLSKHPKGPSCGGLKTKLVYFDNPHWLY